MRKVLLLAAVISIVACSSDNEAERSVNDLRTYVDSIKADHMDYENEAYWENVERGYEEKKQRVDAKITRSNEEVKRKYEALQQDYVQLKEKYVAERSKMKVAPNRKMILRNSLFGEGVIGEDMNFSFMTASNAASVYEYFVNTVNEHRDEYTREDWDEIKVLYEAMDTRKNEIEKELSTRDNRQISVYKLKFAAINTINRPFSKMEENSDAKDKDNKH